MDTIPTMGVINRGDEDLHYADGQGHRWIAPNGIDQGIWEAGMRAHLAEHRSGADGKAPRSPRDQVQPPTTGPAETS